MKEMNDYKMNTKDRRRFILDNTKPGTPFVVNGRTLAVDYTGPQWCRIELQYTSWKKVQDALESGAMCFTDTDTQRQFEDLCNRQLKKFRWIVRPKL